MIITVMINFDNSYSNDTFKYNYKNLGWYSIYDVDEHIIFLYDQKVFGLFHLTN